MTKIYFLLFTAFLFFTGCKTVSKAYNNGDYDAAVELGVKKLNKDPNDGETKQLVKNAYTFAVNRHEEAVRSLSNSSNDNRYEAILKEYNKLQDLYNTIQEYPAAAQLVTATNYSSYVQTYRDKVADVHTSNGDKWMNEGNKRAYREAYSEYRYALRFTGNVAVKKKRDEAYDAALTKVLVVPIQNYGGYGYNSSYRLQQFQNEIMRTLANNMNNDFVKFYSQWDLHSRDVEPDEILEMNLGRITIGRPYDQQNTREVSKEVVVKEIVYKADSVVKQYGTVKARITSTRRTLLSEGELYLSLRDPQGRTLWSDRFTGQHRWQTEFATFTGDERALSESDKSLLSKGNNRPEPREEDIMNELYRQIQSDLSSRLRNHFDRY